MGGKGGGISGSLSQSVMGGGGWHTLCHVCDGWVSNCLLRSVISLYQFCHGLWCPPKSLSRSVIFIKISVMVSDDLWWQLLLCLPWFSAIRSRFSVTVCGGKGWWVQISALILQHSFSVRVSQNKTLHSTLQLQSRNYDRKSCVYTFLNDHLYI
jgi:hypothetical protein